MIEAKAPVTCDIVVGTRPEAIKLAPLVHRLRREPSKFEARIITSGQHGEICRAALANFGLTTDIALTPEPVGYALANIASAVLAVFGWHFATSAPDILVVQGDTTTAMAAALGAFYANVPVVHVEAGLRSGDMANPFPEEANRKIIDDISTILLPPTSSAQRNLLRAGFDEMLCPVTGNTVVDALSMLCDLHSPTLNGTGLTEVEVKDRRLILVTMHRRESWGEDIEAICSAVRSIADRHPDVVIALPVHPNPNVSRSVTKVLGQHPRIRLLAPLDYIPFLGLMRRAHLILTDSGGIQEEAPSFGVPVLVIRRTTERPEAVEAGLARIVGTEPSGIENNVEELLRNDAVRRQMTAATNPFGDGRACDRIAEILDNWRHGERLLSPGSAFSPARVVSQAIPMIAAAASRHPPAPPWFVGGVA